MNIKQIILPIIAVGFAGAFLYQTFVGIPNAKAQARIDTFTHISKEIFNAAMYCENLDNNGDWKPNAEDADITPPDNVLNCNSNHQKSSKDYQKGQEDGLSSVYFRFSNGDFMWEIEQRRKDAFWYY